MLLDGCAQNAGLDDESFVRLMEIKAEKQRIPLNVHLELTYRCNEQCVQCYCVVEHGHEEQAKARELTYEEVTRLLDDLADLGGFYLTFTGGEVLVRRDFFDIVEHAKRKGFLYRIFTNGIALTEPRIKRLAELEPLTVEVSVFSADPAVHDAITRVPGSFARLMKNVERLKAHGLRVYFKTTVMKPNLAGLAQVRQLGRDKGVFAHTFSCEVSPRIDGDIRGPGRYQLDEQQLVSYFSNATWRPQTKRLPDLTPEEFARQKSTCGPAVNGCCVDPYGNVFPCVAFRVPIGNIRERSFRDLWYAPPPAIQDLMSVQTYSELPDCKSCDLVAFCSRCHGDNQLERKGDWKSCHERARLVASAERTVYRILHKDEARR